MNGSWRRVTVLYLPLECLQPSRRRSTVSLFYYLVLNPLALPELWGYDRFIHVAVYLLLNGVVI
jgi:hypothetical protein